MRQIIILAAALLACSSRSGPTLTRSEAPISACYVPPPVGNIVGLGFNGQPRSLGANGSNARAALDLLVNDLGASFVRVEVNAGESDAEAVNDDADPSHFAWGYYDTVFSTPMMQKTWDYIRYLNQLGVEHVELAQHGGIPLWMGTNTPPTGSTQTSYPGPADGRAYVLPSAMEDEFVETCVAMLVYARTRTAAPHPQFDLFSPWNEPEFSGEGEGIDVATSAQRLSILHKLVVRMNALPELTGLQLSVGEDGSEPGMIMTRGAVAGDSLVMARTAATSFHRYGDDSSPASYGDWRGANPPAWLTETNSTWRAACYDTTWSMGMEAAGNLLRALQNGVTAGLAWSDYDAFHSHQGTWQTFGLLSTISGGQSGQQLCNIGAPSDAALDAMTYTAKPTYYALRHVMKWIRPNASPLAVTASGGVQAVAYRNADGTVVVAGRNGSGSLNSTVTLTMSNPPSYLTPRVSTSGSYDQVGSPVALTSGSGVFSLPGSSVFTLLSSPGDGSGGAGGSGGQGGMGSGGQAGAAAGNGGAGGQAAGNGGAPSGGQSGSSGADQGGMSGAGGASAGAGGVSSGGAGQGGAAAGASSGGAGAGGAGSGGAGAGGQAGASGAAGSGGSGPTLIAGWAFNEGSGTTTADASGNGHTGTVNGATWTTTGCKYGNCLSFTGTGHNVTTPDANDLDLGTSFTIMAWVKPTTTSGWHPVMMKANGTNLEAFLLYSDPVTQGAYFTDSGNAEKSVTGGSHISTSAWSNVAMVRNGTTLSYFVNGVSVATATVSALPVVSSSGTLMIGGHSFWSGEWFSGLMDDPRIYGQAMTAAQITAAMGAGL